MENKQQIVEELIKKFGQYAKDNGFQLNPDKKVVERVINGFLLNEEKYGKKYCPCRRIPQPNEPAEEASKKVCPCFWHKEEIKRDGHCFCNLYVK